MVLGKDCAARERRCERGQGTLEYALVLFAFLAVVTTLGLAWHEVRDGVLLRLAVDSASHALTGDGLVGFSQDLLLY